MPRYFVGNSTYIDTSDFVLSVNGSTPDVNGDVTVTPTTAIDYRAYTAGEAIASTHLPLCLHSDGKVYLMTTVEDDVAAFIGFSKTTAVTDASIDVYLPSQRITGFSGLTSGVEYWIDATDLVEFDSVGSGAWTRSIGIADSATSLFVLPGSPIQPG